MKTQFILSTVLALSLSACTAVGPDFTPPSMNMPAAFTAGGGSSLQSPELQMWWRELKDPLLNDLVAQGLANNLTIQTSLARIRKSEAQLRATGINAQTTGNLTSSVNRTGVDNLPTTTNDTSSLGGTFVIDLFGGIKRGQEQAAANLEASGFNLGDARAAVTQSIVMHYVSARFAQEAAALTRKTVASREQTLSLVRAKRRAGTASEFEIVQTEADLFTAKADLQGYLSNFESSVFAMTTVLDADPAPTLLKMQRGAPQASPRGTSLLGKPADLLRNIPSVRVAESTYAAAVAGLGVQEAKLLPSLTISGKLTVNDPKSWSFGPAISLPVFNQPALKANRDAQIAVVEEAMLNWRAAVRAAVGDVETQSHSLLRSNRQVSLLRLAIGSSEKALALNKANFEAGRSSLIELLDAERTTSARRLALASEVQSATIEWANLQVALGRGWKIKQ